jgi:hypothetical protein
VISASDSALLQLRAQQESRAVILVPAGYVLYVKATNGVPTFKSTIGWNDVLFDWNTIKTADDARCGTAIISSANQNVVTFRFDQRLPNQNEEGRMTAELCVPKSTKVEVHAFVGSDVYILGEDERFDLPVLIHATSESEILVSDCVLDLQIRTAHGGNVLATASGEYGLLAWRPDTETDSQFLFEYSNGPPPNVFLPNAIRVSDMNQPPDQIGRSASLTD